MARLARLECMRVHATGAGLQHAAWRHCADTLRSLCGHKGEEHGPEAGLLDADEDGEDADDAEHAA